MIAKRRFLVTGTQGQVAQSLLFRAADHDDIDIIAIGRPDLDLMKPETIETTFDLVQPDLVISAAAYTAVDRAESDEETAWAVNAGGPEALARLAARHKVPLIHLSTDYVFDGSKREPYTETDAVAPLGVYGRTKWEGECRILAHHDDVAILRTAWVYSPFGRNFVKTMLQLSETRDSISVVDDQIGNPTSALDIAEGVLSVARNLLGGSDSSIRGIFNMVSSDDASWADFAEQIFHVSKANGGPSASVRRITTAEYPTPAKRPPNSRLECGKLSLNYGVQLPVWKHSASEVVKALLSKSNAALIKQERVQ